MCRRLGQIAVKKVIRQASKVEKQESVVMHKEHPDEVPPRAGETQ